MDSFDEMFREWILLINVDQLKYLKHFLFGWEENYLRETSYHSDNNNIENIWESLKSRNIYKSS